MRGMVSIGDFSRLSRLSVRTLRRYDDHGLLVPAVVDPASRRRWYSAAQVADAHVICLLRGLDMPLDEVRKIVADRDPVRVRERLVEHRVGVREQAEHLRAVLGELDDLIHDLGPLTGRTITVEERPGLLVASQRVRCSLAELPEATGRSFGCLFRHLARHGIAAAGPSLAVYHGEGFDPERIDVELALPVNGWLAVDRASGVDVRELPPVRAVTTLHTGPYQRIDGAYRAVGAWAGDHEAVLSDQPREVYLVGPERSGPDGLRTEIVWPLT